MLNIFNKTKQPDIVDSTWINGEFTHDEAKHYFRLNEGLKGLMKSRDFKYEALVSIDMIDSDDIDEVLKHIGSMEDLVKEKLEDNQSCYLGLVITGPGFRDLFFYTANPQRVVEIFEQELNSAFDTKVELIIEENQWLNYKNFLPNK